MPDGASAIPAGRIGPNAVLQLAGPVENLLGQGAMARILDASDVPMPAGDQMIPQDAVGRVYHTMWKHFPKQAATLSQRAGAGTARYIRANRIPKAARLLLRMLPRSLSERLLSKAIVDHAWTFCGSGTLSTAREEGEIHFLLQENPLADRTIQPPHLCIWHAAVFAEIFSLILGRAYYCKEVACCALGADVCHFVVSRTAAARHFKGLSL